MIETMGLTKEYKHPVVKDLNLNVGRGEIYGFLGPNGAGKSTTILMILGLLRPTRGKVRIFGREMREDYFATKRKLGVVAESQSFYKEMTGEEYLGFFAALYGVKDHARRARELMARVDLTHAHRLQLGKYSKGMLQKLALVKALMHDPEVLILDEPVSSLDPYGIKQVRDIILTENAKGKTFFISSHLLSEVERTCHRLGIINRGELVVEDTMDGLRRRLSDSAVLEIELETMPDGVLPALKALPFVETVTVQDRLISVRLRNREDRRAEVARLLAGYGCITLSMKWNQMSLEEAFVTITEGNLFRLTGAGAKNDHES